MTTVASVARYVTVRDGVADVGAVLWDGETPIKVDGTLVLESTYQGPRRQPEGQAEADNQRSTEDALRVRRDQLRADVQAMQAGALTLPQLQRVVERNTRATLLLIRLQLHDFAAGGGE